MNFNTVLIGFGNVGRELAKVLLERKNFNNNIKVKGIITSKGSVILDDNWDNKLQDIINKYSMGISTDFSSNISIDDVIERVSPDLAFITIPPSYFTGEPNLSIYRKLLDHNVSFITADKTGLALNYSDLLRKAKKKGLFIGYRATVMAGTPAIDVMRGLRGRNVKSIRSVLNATTNYILTLVESGFSYEAAIKKAIEEKLAEPDPRIDIDGYDASAKLVILVNTLGYDFNINNVMRKSLITISEDIVKSGRKKGTPVKHVASADLEKGTLYVRPEILDPNDPLGNVSGNYNSLVINVDNGQIILKGFAGPAWVTARTMLTDFLEYLENVLTQN
ncbi:MAG: homoserine dehydrogenase [Thermoprotei archaeon]